MKNKTQKYKTRCREHTQCCKLAQRIIYECQLDSATNNIWFIFIKYINIINLFAMRSSFREKYRCQLEMTAMEVEDASCPSVRSVVVSHDRHVALTGTDLLIILDDHWQARSASPRAGGSHLLQICIHEYAC